MEQYDIVVLGLGITGYATISYCEKFGKSVAVTDNREKPPLRERLEKKLALAVMIMRC